MLPLDFVGDIYAYAGISYRKVGPKFQTFPYSHKHSRTSPILMPQKLHTKYTLKLTIHNINPHEILHSYTPFNICCLWI